MHILFELSEKYALVPVEIPQEPKYVIQTKNEVILQALEAWYNKRRKWENGDITQAELQEWMDAFPLQCEENESPAEKGESRYTDFERIMGLKSALEQMDMIVNDNVELIEDCIAHKNYKTAREHLRTLKATVHTLSQVDYQTIRKIKKSQAIPIALCKGSCPVIFVTWVLLSNGLKKIPKIYQSVHFDCALFELIFHQCAVQYPL